MPKTMYLPRTTYKINSGIMIEYVFGTQMIYISGWYDTFVGIEGTEMKLGDFLKELGVKPKDLRKILLQWESDKLLKG
jgi:hypothetical protein